MEFLKPIQKRRIEYEKDQIEIQKILQEGSARANKIAEETLFLVKEAVKQNYFYP
nr:hypothetical protein [Coxiella-like endosymbiont]